MGNRSDIHTESPDSAMEAQLEFHQMYEYTRFIEPLGATENKEYQDHGIIRGLFGTAHSKFNLMYECTHSVEPLVATTNKEFHIQGFIQGVHGPVHAILHAVLDRTVYMKPCGINHLLRDEGSPELADGTEHAFSGINPDNKHFKAGYGITSEIKKTTKYIN